MNIYRNLRGGGTYVQLYMSGKVMCIMTYMYLLGGGGHLCT